MNGRKIVLPLLAAAFGLAACDGGSGVTASGTPTLSIKLTDAPGDFAEAQVKIQQIYLQGEGDNGRVVLSQGTSGYVDLLTLAGGKTVDLVKDAVVPAGTYSELRFVICDAYIKTKDGKVYATQGSELPAGVVASGRLQAPSFCQSGLKVKLPGGAVTMDDEAKVLVVDFDVSQSFGRQAGKSGMWVMHPVIHATDFSASGTIAGTVALAEGAVAAFPLACGGSQLDQGGVLSKFVPRAVGETTYSGLTGTDGKHKVSFVAPGTYTVSFADKIAFTNGDTLTFAATAPASVAVQSGKTSTADYSVSSATCKVAPAQ